MEDFKTLFFEWKWLGCLWSAIDPVMPERRWIIERPAVVTPNCQWEIYYTIQKNKYRVGSAKTERGTAFLAIAKKINDLVSQIEDYSNLFSDSDLERMKKFMAILEKTDVPKPE